MTRDIIDLVQKIAVVGHRLDPRRKRNRQELMARLIHREVTRMHPSSP
jgi:hypothetical protein